MVGWLDSVWNRLLRGFLQQQKKNNVVVAKLAQTDMSKIVRPMFLIFTFNCFGFVGEKSCVTFVHKIFTMNRRG